MGRLKKTCISIVFFLLAGSILLFAEDSKETTGSSWILAAMPFEFSNADMTSESSLAIAQNIPQLILEQFSSQAVRVPSAREVLNRKLNDLRTARLSLFLELSKAVKTRDALVLQNISEKKLKKSIAEQDEKIAELHKKISDNLLEADRSAEDTVPDILTEESFFNSPKGARNFFAATQEKVSLYKNDSSSLLKRPEGVSSDDFSNYDFENAVNTEKIKGLISGKITSYGGYAAVTAELHLFPGGTLAASVTEVGLLSFPLQIARNLARALVPNIANNPPVVLHLAVEPPEARQKVAVGLDGVVFSDCPPEIVADRGIHEITFEAEGYRRASMTYAFSEKKDYEVNVTMIPENPKNISIKVLSPVSGILSIGAVDNYSISAENPMAEIKVDGRSVIGQFTDENGITSFFFIPESFLEQNDSFKTPVLSYDVSANIEKRRRRMYTAYSALIMSLPVTFYYYGTFVNKINANASGTVDAAEVEQWRQRSLFCVGISVSLGAVFGYQLVRYLASTNAVLPKTVKVDKKKNK